MRAHKLKLAIIGTVGVPAKYGGFETLAHHLVQNLNEDLDITVYNSAQNYTAQERVPEWNGAKIKYIPFSANGFQSVIYDIISIIHAAIFSEILLILGVSGCLFLPFIKLFTRKKIIVNIDGMEWRRDKWKNWAKYFLKISEAIAVKYADEIVTDNAALQDYVKEIYGIDATLIEYGSDHNQAVAIQQKDYQKYPFLAGDYAFKVCRIEPENNVHVVLEAFEQYTEMPIVIVGNWDKGDYGQELRAQYAEYKNMFLLDSIYEKEELNLLRSNATVYIHGHSAGGTNPSLVEAMYLGRPIISFDVVYNRVTTENTALFFQKASDLIHTLTYFYDLKPARIATVLKAIADRRYTWANISMKYQYLALGKQLQPTTTQTTELKPRQVSMTEKAKEIQLNEA